MLLEAVSMAGQNKNAPVNYDESMVPDFEVPDVLKCEDGSIVKTVRQWERKRRPELMKMLSEQEYGKETIASSVKNYFKGSYMNVVSAFVSDEKISVDELQTLIDMIQAKKDT